MIRRTGFLLLMLVAISAGLASAQPDEDVMVGIETLAEKYADIAQQIWHYAEVGYLETKSSELLQRTLRDAGFSVETGVAGMPTAFVGSSGWGEPVIGIMAEFDALPGISQDRSPERSIRDNNPAGHACGHHLFGTGSVAAAIAVKE